MILVWIIMYRIEEPFYTLFLPYYHPRVKEILMESRTNIDLRFIISASQWKYGVFSVLMRILIANNDINIGKIHLESMERDKDIIKHIDSHQNHIGVIPAMTLVEDYDKYNNIRYITSAFDNYVFFITQSDNDIIFIDDLKGKKVGVGNKGSIWDICANELLTARGVMAKIKYSRTIEEMARKLYNKELDAIVITDRYPGQLLNYIIYNYPNMTLLQINKYERLPFYYEVGQIDLSQISTNYVPKVLSNDRYLYYNTAMDVYKFPNYMICNRDIPNDVIYRLTEFMFKNADLMKKNINPFTYIRVPIHGGAMEYYDKNEYIMNKDRTDCIYVNGRVRCGKEYL
jgi:hypothetical protein